MYTYIHKLFIHSTFIFSQNRLTTISHNAPHQEVLWIFSGPFFPSAFNRTLGKYLKVFLFCTHGEIFFLATQDKTFKIKITIKGTIASVIKPVFLLSNSFTWTGFLPIGIDRSGWQWRILGKNLSDGRTYLYLPVYLYLPSRYCCCYCNLVRDGWTFFYWNSYNNYNYM